MLRDTARATLYDVTKTDDSPPDTRVAISLRLSPGALKLVDKAAAEQRRTRSETIRLMLAYAAQHMPKGWLP